MDTRLPAFPDDAALPRYLDTRRPSPLWPVLLLSLALHGALIAAGLLPGEGGSQVDARTVIQIALTPQAPGSAETLFSTTAQPPPDTATPPTEATEAVPLTPGEAPATVPATPQQQQAAGTSPAEPAPVTVEASRGSALAADGMDLIFLDVVREQYRRDINDWVRRQPIIYPQSAIDAGREGMAIVSFAIDREGRLVRARVLRSSGTAALDEAALATVRNAAPFPPPPAALPFEVVEDIEVPVRFSLQ